MQSITAKNLPTIASPQILDVIKKSMYNNAGSCHFEESRQYKFFSKICFRQ